MNDTATRTVPDASAATGAVVDAPVGPARWLLLIHQVPPKPDYLRVKVRRRLDRLGAVALKNSVYVLPQRDDTLEHFQWLAREIAGEGGEASVCEAAFVEGVRDEDLAAAFRAARDAEYAEIAAAADALDAAGALARLERRMADATALDYFAAPGRATAADRLRAAADRLREGAAVGPDASTSGTWGGGGVLRGRTWVTREGVFVDRIASAWLIRRFIDPDATFRFVPARGYRPAAGELRFDMFEAEYTHEGDRCTFETLLARFDLDDPALVRLGEIVHDIDLGDAKFGRDEAAGLAALLNGVALSHVDDHDRLAHGGALFESLYQHFRSVAGNTSTSGNPPTGSPTAGSPTAAPPPPRRDAV